MEKKWDTVIPADLKRPFVSGHICPAGHERVKCTLHSIPIRCSGLSGTSPKQADATFCYPQFYQAQQPVLSTQHLRLWIKAHLPLISSITNTAQQAHSFALPCKSTSTALNCRIHCFVSQGQGGRAWLRQVAARIQSQATPREIRGGQSDTKTDSIPVLFACHQPCSILIVLIYHRGDTMSTVPSNKTFKKHSRIDPRSLHSPKDQDLEKNLFCKRKIKKGIRTANNRLIKTTFILALLAGTVILTTEILGHRYVKQTILRTKNGRDSINP